MTEQYHRVIFIIVLHIIIL